MNKLLIMLVLTLGLGACAPFVNYCDETEARAVLRDINPWDVVDAAAIGACAAAQAFNREGNTNGQQGAESDSTTADEPTTGASGKTGPGQGGQKIHEEKVIEEAQGRTAGVTIV